VRAHRSPHVDCAHWFGLLEWPAARLTLGTVEYIFCLEQHAAEKNPRRFSSLKTALVSRASLSLSEEPQHGYGIMQDVLERTDGKVRLWPPTLYGTIKRLTDEELIEPCEGLPVD